MTVEEMDVRVGGRWRWIAHASDGNDAPFKGEYLEVARGLADEVLKNPPLSVRSTVRMRRYYMDRLSREVMFMGAPEKLYLSEDFGEAARAFTEKRKAAPFKGR